jgi:hypothetical protein
LELGELTFGIVDNPDHWAEFMYHPVFAGKKKSNRQNSHHALETGAMPVPTDETGKRISIGGGNSFMTTGRLMWDLPSTAAILKKIPFLAIERVALIMSSSSKWDS